MAALVSSAISTCQKKTHRKGTEEGNKAGWKGGLQEITYSFAFGVLQGDKKDVEGRVGREKTGKFREGGRGGIKKLALLHPSLLCFSSSLSSLFSC